MSANLSSFLQLRFNVFIFKNFGWKMTFFYIVFLGKLYFCFKRLERRKIRAAVDSLFSDHSSRSEKKVIVRDVFRGIFSHYYEKVFNAYGDMSEIKAFFKECIDTRSLGKLDTALNQGKGVLFVTAHYGGIEYIPIYLALKGYPISVIVKFATKQLKDTLFSKTEKLGIKIIDVNQENSVLRSTIRELRDNRIVFIECDEIKKWKPSEKEMTLFLGKRIWVDKTIDLIQRRTGSEIIFGILHRFNMRRYGFILESYAEMSRRTSKVNPSIAGVVLRYLERCIYSNPEQWYQWNNYAEIKTVSLSRSKTEYPLSQGSLRHAFGKA